MTINNSQNKVVAGGNGVMTVFGFSFVGVSAADISVTLTDSNGVSTLLASSLYTLVLNPAPAGQIWGIGGTVTYPLTGSPVPLGSTLTILRTLPLTQETALGNQGNVFPASVEEGLDTLEMQIQQVNETFQRALVAPVTDPSAPLPLPPAAQRANQALVFDSLGNPVAGAIPASGLISSAMQPVVSAATLALGRAAFGLGAIAVEGIGTGLADDGAGNVRVAPPLSEVATNQSVSVLNHTTSYMATGALTFTLARANAMFPGFFIDVYALTAPITFAIDSHDNFYGQSSGASYIIPKGCVARIKTDALTSGLWYASVTGISPKFNVRVFAASTTYVPSIGLIGALAEAVGGGGAGGGAQGATGSILQGGGGGAGQYARSWLSAAQIGPSQAIQIGAGGAGFSGFVAGNAGGPTSFGGLVIAPGGGGGSAANASNIGNGGAGGRGGTGQLLIPGGGGDYGLLTTIITVQFATGNGGSSLLGSGGRNVPAGGGNASNGIAGQGYGSGGGGGQVNAASSAAAGGAGAGGLCVVTEFLAQAW